MDNDQIIQVINYINDFIINEVPQETKFWMIRTQKGYFYNEFISKKFIGLAFNSITNKTDFSESGDEALRDLIILNYPRQKRPTSVINKCKSFIFEIKEGDILVIPSAGTEYITFAVAGKYYEDESKTYDIEKTVISRIINNDVLINEVSCPYRKRRSIKVLRTVNSSEVNYSLYRAITNHHGISNLDNYANYILNMLHDMYIFKDELHIVYNVKRTSPIPPRVLSALLYNTTDYLCKFIEESNISAQININSPGPVDFTILLDLYDFIKNNYKVLFGILFLAGGGSFLTFTFPGMPEVIKKIFTLPENIRTEKSKAKSEAELKEIEVYEKKLALYEKIKSCGINPIDLSMPVSEIVSSCNRLEVHSTVITENSDVIPDNRNIIDEENLYFDILPEDESDD